MVALDFSPMGCAVPVKIILQISPSQQYPLSLSILCEGNRLFALGSHVSLATTTGMTLSQTGAKPISYFKRELKT